MRQPVALVVDPPLETGCGPNKEPVEQRPGIKPHGSRVIASLQRVLEFPHVDRDHRWIEAERLLPEKEIATGQVAALKVEQLVQTAPGALRVALRPEVAVNLVA